MTGAEIAPIAQAIIASMARSRSDYTSELDWDDMPPTSVDPDTTSQATLIGGANYLINNPDAAVAMLHELWRDPLLADGWTRGTYNLQQKTHPDIAQFEHLEDHKRTRYYVFEATTRALEGV